MKRNLLTVIICIVYSLTHAQNVGVGTSNPQEKLDVNGGVRIGYTPSTNSGGTMRFNNNEMEYNNGFGWRSLVNSFKDSAISTLTPFSSTIRNTWLEIPVSMTVTEQGVYLVIFKANGYNNSVYYPGSGNSDNAGVVDFRLNGGSRAIRNFIIAEDSFSPPASGRRDFGSNPTEYTLIQTLFPGDKMQIFANVYSLGSTPNPWVINEAQILLIRLY